MSDSILATKLIYRDPIDAFWNWHQQPGYIWLDSNDSSSRYSFMCFSPFRLVKCKNGILECDRKIIQNIDPWQWLEKELTRFQLPAHPDLPPFSTGVAGYFGYELNQYIEKIPLAAADPFYLPDLCLGFYESCYVWDHEQQVCWLLCSGMGSETEQDRIKRAAIHLEQGLLRWEELVHSQPATEFSLSAFQPMQTKSYYTACLQQLHTHIQNGDIYQANYAQAFTARLAHQHQLPALYNALRQKAPEPYGGYLHFDDVCLLSTSPERFLQVHHGIVRTDPIKGTAKRIANYAADQQVQHELQNNPKERAENIMILDLMRNDLSKVCWPNSVSTPKYCQLETFSHVHHLVSQVQGLLKPDQSVIDLLRATFPGGSITGAPKIRAQEIIAQLEPIQRGPYCGAFGYVSFTGDLELAMTIRTLIAQPTGPDCSVHFFVGGGITYDSDPELEYEETLAKAAGFFAL